VANVAQILLCATSPSCCSRQQLRKQLLFTATTPRTTYNHRHTTVQDNTNQIADTRNNTRDKMNNSSNMANKEEQEEKGNVKVVHLEIIRKDEHAEWKANPQFVGDTLKRPRTPDSLRPIGQEHRFDISHLNKNLRFGMLKLLLSPFHFAHMLPRTARLTTRLRGSFSASWIT